MTQPTLSPRERAHQYVVDALKTGVRGEARTALQEAERLLSFGNQGQSPTELEYRNLKPGQKLPDPNRAGFIMRSGARAGPSRNFGSRFPSATRKWCPRRCAGITQSPRPPTS